MAVLAKGLDYSFARPDPVCLKNNGYTFVCRYVWTSYSPGSPGYPGKMLTKPEADKLKASGIRIVSNFESWVGRPLDGYDAGVSDARVAVQNTINAGGPASPVVYFSVDIDTRSLSATQLSAISFYFEGAASVIGVAQVGAYGGYHIIKRLADRGLAQRFWQTYAWSGGQWDSRCHIRQVRNGVLVCGGDTDINEQHLPSIGAWGEVVTTPRPTLFTDLDLAWS